MLSALALVVGFLLVPAQPATAAPACPIAIAHRGNTAGGPIENSIGAFNATFATGAKWFEADVLWTSDNVPVLMHDQTVDRTTTGTGAVASMTAAQFTALTLNDGQHPPTLDQALALIRASSDRQMVLEVKNILTAAQQTILLDELRGLEAQVHPNGFADHLPSLQALKAADPLLSISLATYDPVLPAPAGLSGEDMEYTYVTAARVTQLHAAGLAVRAWVPNSTSAWQNLRTYGVDAIMTNDVGGYVTWAATACATPPPPPPTTKEFVTNRSFETNLTGWTGQATSISRNSRVTGGYDGSWAIRSINGSTIAGKNGFASKPSTIDGTANSTVAGKTYTASVWVKPDAVGQRISIYLRETRPGSSTTIRSKTVTITAPTTGWQRITNAYVASATGNAVAFHVFVTNAAPQRGFNADLISLTTTN